MTFPTGRVGRVVWLGTVVAALATADSVRGQATGQPSGAQDTSAARRAQAGPAQSASTGSIAGIVLDSLNGRPLVNAVVSAEGLTSQAVTDSGGLFRVDSVPPGRYRVGVFHPVLDSLGLSMASPPLQVTAGATLSLIFATPSAPTIVRLTCGASQVDTMMGIGPAVVIGRVLDAETDAPAAGVGVSLRWTHIHASVALGVQTVRSAWDTTTSPNGEFRFCHVPANLAGIARAISPTDGSTVSRPFAVNQQLVSFLVLRVPGTGAADAKGVGATPASGGGILTGRIVRPDDGTPIAGAQVVVVGSKQAAVTGDSGQFTLRGLPTGSRTLEVRAVGWDPVTIAVELTRSAPRHVIVPLGQQRAVLQAVVVTATLNSGLHRVGFDTRKQMGIGHFLTPDDVAKRDASEVVDLMAGMPGIMRRVGRNGDDYLTGTRGAGGCVGYWIDGNPYREVTPGDINEVVRPDDIGAVEVYQSSESPAQYAYTPPTMATTTTTMSRRAGSMSGGSMSAGGTNGRSNGGTGCVKILIWTKARLGLP